MDERTRLAQLSVRGHHMSTGPPEPVDLMTDALKICPFKGRGDDHALNGAIPERRCGDHEVSSGCRKQARLVRGDHVHDLKVKLTAKRLGE